MATTLAPDLFWQPLVEIACLLQVAADHLWEAADNAGIDSPLHSLGLGSFLAASQAAQLLPSGKEVPDHIPNESNDPLSVLETVEQLTLQLDPRLAGASDLSVAVADLVRETRTGAA